MSARIDHVIPAETRIGARFLERFLPALAEPVVASCVEATTSSGELVLDPFCQSPATVLGAVARGRRALATSFNPIEAFAVRQTLAPLPARELDAVTTRLAESRRGGQSLRDHVLRLYRCICPSCRRAAVADSFIWDLSQSAPLQKRVRCPECGYEGVSSIQADDLTVLEQIEERGLTYFFVLDRLAPVGDTARADGERLLRLYTRRARYALAHMTINTEAEFGGSAEEAALKFLILACLVRGGLFERPPRSEEIPGHARGSLAVERNVWHTFEEAWRELREQPAPPPGLRLAEATGCEAISALLRGGETHNAAIAHCSLRDLARELPVQSVGAVVTPLLTANQRYWRLCFLWAGWLFGRDHAAPLRALLHQNTPDWPWYARALAATFRTLRPKLRAQGHIVALLSSRRSSQAETTLIALAAAKMKQASYVYSPASVADAERGAGDYQLAFAKSAEVAQGAAQPPDRSILSAEIKSETARAALELLAARGEPLPAGWLRIAAFARLSLRGSLERVMLHDGGEALGYEFVDRQVEMALGTEARGLLTPMEWEAGFVRGSTIPMFWSERLRDAAVPLGDRVEEAALEILRNTLALPRRALQERLYMRFPGLQAPERDLVAACLDSYGEEASPGYWQMRSDDRPEAVDSARDAVTADLTALAERIGAQVVRDAHPYTLLWQGPNYQYAFLFLPAAILSRLDALPPEPGTTRYAVVPDSRVALIRLKLERSPIYGRILQRGGWAFIRWPYLRALLDAEQVDRHSLKQIEGLEPVVEKGQAQIPLF